jgi:hypothetical protein
METQGHERRRHPRTDVGVAARVQILGPGGEPVATSTEANLVNISVSGAQLSMNLEAAMNLQVDGRLVVAFEADGGGEAELPCKVRWLDHGNGGDPLAGIEFDQLQRQAVAALGAELDRDA